MELLQTRQVILLGFVLIGLCIIGLYNAMILSPTCTPVLSDVRVCEPNIGRVIPSLLVGTIGAGVLYGNMKKYR